MDLFEAAKTGNIDEIKKLLKTGANVNTLGDSGKTPLWAAVVNYHIEAVKLLLDCDAQYREKALMVAVNSNYVEIIKLLLEKGVDFLNYQEGNTGRTVLIIAAKANYDNQEIVELLLKNGADTNVKDKLGMTALDYARKENKTEVVKLLENRV